MSWFFGDGSVFLDSSQGGLADEGDLLDPKLDVQALLIDRLEEPIAHLADLESGPEYPTSLTLNGTPFIHRLLQNFETIAIDLPCDGHLRYLRFLRAMECDGAMVRWCDESICVICVICGLRWNKRGDDADQHPAS